MTDTGAGKKLTTPAHGLCSLRRPPSPTPGVHTPRSKRRRHAPRPPGSELGACFVAGAPCVPGVGALPPCLSLDSCTTHAAAAVRVADLRIEHASSAAGVGRGVH